MAPKRSWMKTKNCTTIALVRHKIKMFSLPNSQKTHHGECKYFIKKHMFGNANKYTELIVNLNFEGQPWWATVANIWSYRLWRLAVTIFCTLLIWRKTVKSLAKFLSHPLLPNLRPIMMYVFNIKKQNRIDLFKYLLSDDDSNLFILVHYQHRFKNDFPYQ